jgi:glycosyltransferase involved in cell wall biosynthesis
MLVFDRKHAPAVWIGCCHETWLPSAGILYIHHPERQRLPEVPTAWPRGRQIFFGKLWQWSMDLGLSQAAPPSAHRKLANSYWTQQTYAGDGGGDADVVYPPVPPFDQGLPWSQREDRVVMLGRWVGPKRLPLVIEVVAGARRAGAQVSLAFVGFWHCAREVRRSIEEAAAGCDWIERHEHASRAAVMDLAGRSRYGIHAMADEHFGIAVAELATAGCVVLVPDSGGPAEIVEDARQIYHDAADGTQKLIDIVTTSRLQEELHLKARGRGLRFSPENFVRKIQQVVAEENRDVAE